MDLAVTEIGLRSLASGKPGNRRNRFVPLVNSSLLGHQQKYEDLVSTNDYSLSPKAAKAAPGLQLE